MRSVQEEEEVLEVGWGVCGGGRGFLRMGGGFM